MTTAREQAPTIELSTPLQYVRGVGPGRAEKLARLGLHTARDVLFFFPREYQDLTDLRALNQLEEGRPQSVLGTIEEIDLRDLGGGRSVLGVLVRQGRGYLRAIWFNQPFMSDKFHIGQQILLYGRPKLRGGRWEFPHPHVRTAEGAAPAGQLLPVYSLTEGLHQHHLRSIVRNVVDSCADGIDEVFPEGYLAAHALLPIKAALRQIHFPESQQSLSAARRRLVYQELLVLQLALAVKRQQVRDALEAPMLAATAKIDARIRRLFPFTLTVGQNDAIREIVADMASTHPMNRLLQGDVGSGKTVVAVYAMLLAVAHGMQAALMAPTEILARQHARTLDRSLAASKVRRGLLTGGISARERAELLAKIKAGEIDMVVGTQAFVESDVEFAKLGLVVIDEQHKFGVRQRAALRRSGLNPHYLVMTATPIPRTIGMTLFGDLDISTLRESPPGRQPVHTYLPPRADWPRWWEFFRKKLREGRQGYVITPLVDDSEQVATANLAETFESLANGELEEFRLGLVHGRMSAEEKEAAMEAFHAGRTQALVATSVVEVGVDVPNATLMTILGAERFGLAQLHQLRGRVSRGAHAGYCTLLAEPQSPESQRRLAAVVESTDGFRLAEVDFNLRGPGDLLGTRQHGLPPLRIADLQRDTELLEEARRDAQALVAADPGLRTDAHERLRRMVLARYGQALDLGDVG